VIFVPRDTIDCDTADLPFAVLRER
jgi:hypothetical protein